LRGVFDFGTRDQLIGSADRIKFRFALPGDWQAEVCRCSVTNRFAMFGQIVLENGEQLVGEAEGAVAYVEFIEGREGIAGLPGGETLYEVSGKRRSYQRRERLHTLQTESITGTSTSTPTTVASAAGLVGPNSVIATATASSKKLLAPMSAPGEATLCGTLNRRISR
jgi:hypothetical protein